MLIIIAIITGIAFALGFFLALAHEKNNNLIYTQNALVDKVSGLENIIQVQRQVITKLQNEITPKPKDNGVDGKSKA